MFEKYATDLRQYAFNTVRLDKPFKVDASKKLRAVGDVIVVSVKNVIPSSDIKKGAVSKALIVRTKKEIRRADGSYIRFDDNACVLLNNAGELRGSRIFGPVARELRAVNMKVVSLAPEVL